MALLQTVQANRGKTLAYPSHAGEVVAHKTQISLNTSDYTLVANDIIEMSAIPDGCRVVDLIVDSDDLDSSGTPTIDFDVGIMSGDWQDDDATRTCGAEFISGATIAQGGGVVRPTLKTAFRTVGTSGDRSIGIKITTLSATPVEGIIGLTVLIASE